MLDAKQGGLTTELRVDAHGGVVLPSGGVHTGGGVHGRVGRRGVPVGSGSTGALGAGAVLAVAVAGMFVLRRRRHRP